MKFCDSRKKAEPFKRIDKGHRKIGTVVLWKKTKNCFVCIKLQYRKKVTDTAQCVQITRNVSSKILFGAIIQISKRDTDSRST